MSVQSAIYTRLSGEVRITNLVGTRIYPNVAPLSAVKPYITFFIISEEHEHHMGGASGLAHPTVQFDIWADSNQDAEAIAEQIRDVCDGYRGTVDSVNIRRMHLESRQTGITAPLDGSDAAVHRVTVDYSMSVLESIPALG